MGTVCHILLWKTCDALDLIKNDMSEFMPGEFSNDYMLFFSLKPSDKIWDDTVIFATYILINDYFHTCLPSCVKYENIQNMNSSKISDDPIVVTIQDMFTKEIFKNILENFIVSL